jgi:hypothetical protein
MLGICFFTYRGEYTGELVWEGEKGVCGAGKWMAQIIFIRTYFMRGKLLSDGSVLQKVKACVMDGEDCDLTEIFQFSSLSIYASLTMQHEHDRFPATQSLHSVYSCILW